jgi:8-oxo-dGTP diphosphatase
MKLPLKWEFPGGKIEEGESKEACLVREIKEELDIEITVKGELQMVSYKYDDFSICLYPFLATLDSGEPKAIEHAELKWVSSEEMLNYDWAAADIPIVKEYLSQ